MTRQRTCSHEDSATPSVQTVADAQAAIMARLAAPRLTRDELVPFYAAMIRAIHAEKAWEGVGDVNAAIANRWTWLGLDYIKRKAWIMAGDA